MQPKTGALLIVTTLTALLGAASFLAGCSNGSATAAASEPAADEAAAASEVAADPTARAEWENELARREAELDRLEERLAETARELEIREGGTAATESSTERIDVVGGLAERDGTDEIGRIDGEPETARDSATMPHGTDFAEVVDEPAPAPRTVWVTVPETEPLEIAFLDTLTSEKSVAGDPLRARLVAEVIQDGLVALPAGTELRGSVVEAVATRKIGGQARLTLQFDQVVLPSGDRRPIGAALELLGKRQTAKDAGTIGGSAAGGALLGRILAGDDDRDKGTVIGAVLGAAVGTAVASRNANLPVSVEPGQTAELFLQSPLELAVLAPPEAPALARNLQ